MLNLASAANHGSTSLNSDINNHASRQVTFVFLRTAYIDFSVTGLDIKMRVAVRVCPLSMSHAA